jgi:AcrR family transcriptional regulator
LKTGKWHPLAERLSRWARIRLLEVALDGRTQADIAKMCGVTPQAVFNWVARKEYHPNDKNAATLLRLAWRVDKKRVQAILRAEAERYLAELKKAGID